MWRRDPRIVLIMSTGLGAVGQDGAQTYMYVYINLNPRQKKIRLFTPIKTRTVDATNSLIIASALR